MYLHRMSAPSTSFGQEYAIENNSYQGNEQQTNSGKEDHLDRSVVPMLKVFTVAIIPEIRVIFVKLVYKG